MDGCKDAPLFCASQDEDNFPAAWRARGGHLREMVCCLGEMTRWTGLLTRSPEPRRPAVESRTARRPAAVTQQPSPARDQAASEGDWTWMDGRPKTREPWTTMDAMARSDLSWIGPRGHDR